MRERERERERERGGGREREREGAHIQHTQAPHCASLRAGVKFGDLPLVDSMMKDGLICAFGDHHMGITAEKVAVETSVSRQEQDTFSAQSQNKTEAAQKNGLFQQEIVPVSVPSRKGRNTTKLIRIFCTDFFLKIFTFFSVNFSLQVLSLWLLMSSHDMERRRKLLGNSNRRLSGMERGQ